MEYQGSGEDLLARVVNSSAIFVQEETSYDNWNGGTYGHDVILFLPPENFGEVTLARKNILRLTYSQSFSCVANP